jgi:ubiquinone/menaquinone biosynthesis C-methylase UbiE
VNAQARMIEPDNAGTSMFHTTIDCLDNGAPHQASVEYFMKKVSGLSQGEESSAIRTLAAWEIFQRTEMILESNDISVQPFSDMLIEMGDALARMSAGQNHFAHKLNFSEWARKEADFREHTADHYGNLFKSFDDWHYYEEATQLLKLRLERNGINLGDISHQTALDAGCGGGRYSFALKALGFGQVTGVDFSDKNIETATSRANARKVAGLAFRKGNVLDLPFDDNSFDFVFSNGVIHHTESVEKGVAEMFRVMKKGGTGWLYIIEKKGGLHWDMVEILRTLMQPVDKAYARAMFQMLGVPSNRIFYMLDHVMVPINTRLTPKEIEQMLADAGLSDIQRLTRGGDFDRMEKIHSVRTATNAEAVEWKWGVGENRYLFRK